MEQVSSSNPVEGSSTGSENGSDQDLLGQDVDVTAETFDVTYDITVSNDDATDTAARTASWSLASGSEAGLDYLEIAIAEDGGDGCDREDFSSPSPVDWTKLVANAASSGYQLVDGALDGDGQNVFLDLSHDRTYCTGLRATDIAAKVSAVSFGTMGWSPKYLTVVDDGYKLPDDTSATNCKSYLESEHYRSYGDGVYWLDPDGSGGTPEFKNYCDMSTGGGGWALVDNIAGVSDVISVRSVGGNDDINTTGGRVLPSYSWSPTPQLLCKSSFYSGDLPWVTFNVLAGQAGLNYPTSANVAFAGASGLFSVAILNNNTDNGSDAWIYTGNSRVGTVAIGNSLTVTCACGYATEVDQGISGVGGATVQNATCSTYVR